MKAEFAWVSALRLFPSECSLCGSEFAWAPALRLLHMNFLMRLRLTFIHCAVPLQVRLQWQAPLAVALATPVSLLMINGALSYNTHVLDKVHNARAFQGSFENPSSPRAL